MKEKIFSLSRRFFSHELVAGSSVNFIGAQVANASAFFLTLFLARAFSPSQYGDFAVFIYFLTYATNPAQAFQPGVVRFSAEFFFKKQLGKAGGFYKHTLMFSLIIGLLSIIFFAFGAHVINKFFHVPSVAGMVAVGFIVAAVYLTVPNNGFLQGMTKFLYLALAVALGGVIKLLLGIAFVFMGFGVVGVLWGYFFSFFISFLITLIPLKFLFPYIKKRDPVSISSVISYSLPAGISLFALSSFIGNDYLLVKHFFIPQQAGIYAGMATVGKVVFYLTASITAVMFPLVIKRYEEKRNFHNLFFLSLFLVLAPSLCVVILYFLFPQFFILLFLGKHQYQVVSPLLGWYGIVYLIFSLLNVLVNFLLSLKRTKVIYLIISGALLQVALLWFYHKNFAQVIFITLGILLVLFITLLLYYVKFYYSRNEK